jgi:hypothetical protein
MLLLIKLLVFVQFQTSGWELFEKTRFKWEYDEDLGYEVQMPIFDNKIKSLEGKEITLTGHYLPLGLAGNRIIISKLPYAACFFCGGGAGPESVAEVVFSTKQEPFMMDELLTIKGKLELNVDDLNRMVFILTDAKVVKS